MKKFIFICLAITATCFSNVSGQEKEPTVKDRSTVHNSSVPDWQSNYQQEMARDYIRRRAQEKTAARQARIEGMKWLGHSPSRPVVSTTPFTSSAPSWVTGAPLSYWGPGFLPSIGHGQPFGWAP